VGQPAKTTGSEEEVVAVPEGSVPEAVAPASETKEPQAKPETKPTVKKPQPPTPAAAGTANTTPKAAVTPAKPAVETNAKEAWNVQVGAFKDRVNAENLLKKLKQEGFSARLVEMKSGEVSLSKVLVQAGEDRASADRLAKALSEKGYPVLVVRLP
jgi:cell division protein FtsN